MSEQKRAFVILGNQKSGDIRIKGTVEALGDLENAIREAIDRGVAVRAMTDGELVVRREEDL